MSASVFPAVQPETEAPRAQLPLAMEVAWDFALGRPIFSGGEPLVVSGANAVKVWCWLALQTARRRYAIYTWDYGHELEDLVGKPYTGEVKESEAIRYVREALEINPYIRAVRQVDVTFGETSLHVTATIETIYGEVDVNV